MVSAWHMKTLGTAADRYIWMMRLTALLLGQNTCIRAADQAADSDSVVLHACCCSLLRMS